MKNTIQRLLFSLNSTYIWNLLFSVDFDVAHFQPLENLSPLGFCRLVLFCSPVSLQLFLHSPSLVEFEERPRDCSPGHAGKEGLHLAMTEASRVFSRAGEPVWDFSRGMTGSSGSLSCGAREVKSPCEWRGGMRHCSRVMVGESGFKMRWRRIFEVFLGLRQETLCSLDLCQWPQGASKGASEKSRYCGFGRGLSGLHCFWCNGRGPHLEWSQEPQGSSPFRTPIAGSLQSWDRRVRPRLEWRNGTLLASPVVHGVTGHFSSSVVPAGFSGRYPGVSVPLSVVPSSKGLSSKRCPGIRILSRADREIGVFRHVSPSTWLCLEYPRETGLILRCTGKGGNPFKTKQGNRPSCRDQEGSYIISSIWLSYDNI